MFRFMIFSLPVKDKGEESIDFPYNLKQGEIGQARFSFLQNKKTLSTYVRGSK